MSNPDKRDDQIEFLLEVLLFGDKPFYKVGFDREGKMQMQQFRKKASGPWSFKVCPDLTELTPAILLQIL
jgi:hypothetical protein